MQIEEPIPKELFKILACPVCKSNFRYNKDKTKLICIKCNTAYPIENGIPVLIPHEMQKQ